MSNLFHIELNGCGFMLEGPADPEMNATGANPVAPRTVAEGFYQRLEMREWRAGVGRENPADGGYLDATLETRYPGKVVLPPQLQSVQIEGACCHFTETCDALYMAKGESVYIWSGTGWDLFYAAGFEITDIEVFDGYMHVALGNDIPYRWFDLADGSSGDAPYAFNLFYVYAGLLYGASCNEIRYTNGSLEECDADPRTPPTDDPCAGPGDPPDLNVPWCWEGPIRVGGCSDCCCINGMAGNINGSLQSQQLIISTCDKLYALLPGDILFHFADWPTVDQNNGVGMLNHFGSIYIPVGHGLYRMTPGGDLVDVSISQNEGLPCDKAGKVRGIVSQENWLLIYIDGEKPSLWAYNGEGWHFVTCLEEADQGPGAACGAHYSAALERMFLCTAGEVATFVTPDVTDKPWQSENYRFASTGYIDLGIFRGDFPRLEKDYYGVYINGTCISPERPVSVYWNTGSEIAECNQCYDSDAVEWQLLGVATANSQFLPWPCDESRPTASQMRLRVELETDDPTISPIVEEISLEYLTHFIDSYRWDFAVHLPRECLNDVAGLKVDGYKQSEWDRCVCEAVESVGPVHFVDLDGREYHIKILDFTRRISNFGCAKDKKTGEQVRVFDISWYLNAIQICPEGIQCGTSQ